MIGGSNRLIGIIELAEFLGLAPSTVYKAWRGYGIPHVKIGPLVKFRERDVALYLERLEAETAKATAKRRAELAKS